MFFIKKLKKIINIILVNRLKNIIKMNTEIISICKEYGLLEFKGTKTMSTVLDKLYNEIQDIKNCDHHILTSTHLTDYKIKILEDFITMITKTINKIITDFSASDDIIEGFYGFCDLVYDDDDDYFFVDFSFPFIGINNENNKRHITHMKVYVSYENIKNDTTCTFEGVLMGDDDELLYLPNCGYIKDVSPNFSSLDGLCLELQKFADL